MGKQRTSPIKDSGPELPDSQLSSFRICLLAEATPSISSCRPVSGPEARGLDSRSGTSASHRQDDSPRREGALTSMGEQRKPRRPYQVSEAPSPQDALPGGRKAASPLQSQPIGKRSRWALATQSRGVARLPIRKQVLSPSFEGTCAAESHEWRNGQ
jgi:hypothetical protein